MKKYFIMVHISTQLLRENCNLKLKYCNLKIYTIFSNNYLIVKIVVLLSKIIHKYKNNHKTTIKFYILRICTTFMYTSNVNKDSQT